MTLLDLTHDEQLALIGLVRLMIRLDGQFSPGEAQQLDGIVGELGEETFSTLVDEANETFRDTDALRDRAAAIERKEARELIYGTLLDLAVHDGVAFGEADLLEWLQKTWQLPDPEFAPEG